VNARYSQTSADDNRLLLLALTEAWGEKCYWCRKPKLFRELQIDHIIPRRPRGGVTAERDVDAVENLAPICGPCNQEKTNEDYQRTPRVESQLNNAAKRARTVQRTLGTFRRDAQVTKALLAITAADLDDERIAGAVEALGAVVLSVLRRHFPELLEARYAEDYTVQRPAMEYKGRFYRVDDGASVVELDGKSRRAAVILEDVLDIPMRYALDTVREEVRAAADHDVERCMQRHHRPFLNVEINSKPSGNSAGVYFHEMRYAGGKVEIEGEFEGTFTADVDEEDPDPDRWTQSRGAAFDYDGQFVATFGEEGLLDIGIDVNNVSESWSHTALHSMDLTD
jgi:hypothetical protein